MAVGTFSEYLLPAVRAMAARKGATVEPLGFDGKAARFRLSTGKIIAVGIDDWQQNRHAKAISRQIAAL